MYCNIYESHRPYEVFVCVYSRSVYGMLEVYEASSFFVLRVACAIGLAPS